MTDEQDRRARRRRNEMSGSDFLEGLEAADAERDRLKQELLNAERLATNRLEALNDLEDKVNGQLNDLADKLVDRNDRLAKITAIIEEGDRRLLAADGPVGNQPPQITLDEWRRMYVLASGFIICKEK